MADALARKLERERERLRGRWEPPPVDPKVSGGVRYEYAELHRLLGGTAFSVWVALLWRRNQDGVSRASNGRLAGIPLLSRNAGRTDRKVSARQARRAISRLRDANLVTDGDEGWERVVLGDYRDGVLTVPAVVEMALRSLPLKGGPRRSRVAVIRGQRTKVSTDYRPPDPPARPKRAGSATKAGTLVNMGKVDLSPPERDPAAWPPTLEEKKLEETMATRPKPKRPDRASFDPEPMIRLLQGGGAALPPYRPPLEGKAGSDGRPLIPPYPSDRLVPDARTPPAPRVTADMGESRRLDLLLRSFRSATENRYGKPSWVYANGKLPEKLRARLDAAAKALEAKRIPPAGWAAWSCDVWSEYGSAERAEAAGRKHRKMPPIGWVFDPKRIEEKSGWYSRRAGSYAGRRAMVGDLHRDLLRRWEEMVARIRRAGGDRAPEVEIREIVDRLWPDGFDRAVEEAKAEAVANQRALDNLLRHGDWLW